MSDPISASTGVVVSIEALVALGGIFVAVIGAYISVLRRVAANELALVGLLKAIDGVAKSDTVARIDADAVKLRAEVDRLQILEARRRGREEVSSVSDAPRRSPRRPGDSSGPHG